MSPRAIFKRYPVNEDPLLPLLESMTHAHPRTRTHANTAAVNPAARAQSFCFWATQLSDMIVVTMYITHDSATHANTIHLMALPAIYTLKDYFAESHKRTVM